MFEYLVFAAGAVLAYYLIKVLAKFYDLLKSYMKIFWIGWILGALTAYALMTGDLIPFNSFAFSLIG